MIFQFPDPETLRLAVGSGLVPADVAALPAKLSFDADGRPAVEIDGKPTAVANALKKLGVKAARSHPADPADVPCWPAALPLERDSKPVELASNAPVLFDLPAAQFAAFVTEMLRLGNDRQSFLPLEPVGDAEEGRILLKVVGPPYYTLLRAIDPSNEPADVTAYVKALAARVGRIRLDPPARPAARPAGRADAPAPAAARLVGRPGGRLPRRVRGA